ncbi:MAG: N-glycosylase/DNA lyase [Euryarchaeota archaeon]|nr:N-glycosylase/DNA lyase [Euryarchaeota archaeon]
MAKTPGKSSGKGAPNGRKVKSPQKNARGGWERRAHADIKAMYREWKRRIAARLVDFDNVWKKASDEELFAELAFCLLTPQSKAKSCGAAISALQEKGLLFCDEDGRIARELNGVRFHNKKSKYVVSARKTFMKAGKLTIRDRIVAFSNPKDAREWLVQSVKGMGYKEASHFLRNVGKGSDLAILDRHILKNLRRAGVIKDIPDSLPRKRYYEIEGWMRRFAWELGIPLAHLDLLFWCAETGEVYK